MKMLSRALAAIALVLPVPWAAAQGYPPTRLNVVGNLGITTQYKEIEQPFWTRYIEQASHGQVTAQIKPWNEMGLKGPEVIKLLRQGLFDIGTTQMSFLAGDGPINDGTDLPGVSTSLEVLREVTQAFRPYLEKYYEDRLGLKILGLWSFQAQLLYCTKEIDSLADLKGRKVRTGGAAQAAFIEYFGGSGVNMAFGEVQQGLQNGVVDCAITGALGGYSAKWYEAAKYLYALPINWASSISAVNLKRWNALDSRVQALILAGYEKLGNDIYAQNERENTIGLACLTGSGDCPNGKPSAMILKPIHPGDLDLRRKALEERVLPDWAARCGPECTANWNASVGRVVDMTAKAK